MDKQRHPSIINVWISAFAENEKN